MSETANIHSSLPSSIKVTIPSEHPSTPLSTILSRWSETLVSPPYVILTPTLPSDIPPIIAFARSQNLRLIPVNGGHASFVPITEKTLYLDLASPSFKTITLNEEKQEVTFGGGSLTGEVVKELSRQGWYTLTANSDVVGMAGWFLGGGNSGMTGVHGFGIDHVHRIQMIPFTAPMNEAGEPNVLTLSRESAGAEKDLFNTLRGAGLGLGVILSITLKAWQICTLNMTENKVWTRRLMFPGAGPNPGITTAARLYKALLLPPPAMTAVLVFLRAPPTAPRPGSPIIMLALSYFGPSEDGKKFSAPTYGEEYTQHAVSVVEGFLAWENLNASSAPLNAHGGFKEYHGAFCHEVSEESIVEAYKTWEVFTAKNLAGRGTSYLVIGSWGTDQLVQNASKHDDKMSPARDRGVFVQVVPWCKDSEDKGEADVFGRKATSALREADRKEGRKDWHFANNLRAGQNLEDVWTDEQIQRIREVKGVWDKDGVGWNPAVEGW
ncbi:hypothetical protein BCR34DRAFT_478736 [Clohesyomyces aquaticus]|uniref:FAD-binding PCMH-type domain-containing protein n=1 Tax=Clohesyomyces aquaticus TaxID=1231657 RepID=A0A1Y1ZYV0_9PLEO|nr:hypothetical protein BCR34DRAFT_478736 [Clohesyomyces aquaticus]